MKIYIVKRYWEVCDEVEVKADFIDEAIQKAHDLPLSINPEYVQDSINTDAMVDVQEIS